VKYDDPRINHNSPRLPTLMLRPMMLKKFEITTLSWVISLSSLYFMRPYSILSFASVVFMTHSIFFLPRSRGLPS